MCERHQIKGFPKLYNSLQAKGIIIISDTIWVHLTSTTIHPSCRCNNPQGYIPLFLCHGCGRMSESNVQITAAILIETSEWICKVYTERIATDTFSLGQPHFYFLRLWKGKVLTDLLEVTLVFPRPVHSYCHRVRHLSPTRTVGKQFCYPERRVCFSVSGMQESAYGSLFISQWGSLPRPWSFLPGEPAWDPYHFSRNKSAERPLLTTVLPECLWSLPHPF